MRRALAVLSTGVLLCALAATPAFAAAPSGTGTVTVNATVNETLTFAIISTGDGNGASFSFPSLNPGQSETVDNAVQWETTTNDPNGFSVSIAGSGDFTGPVSGDTIPLGDLSMWALGQSPQPITTSGVVDFTQGGFSPSGVSVHDLAEMSNVPNVPAGTYSTTLTYTATGG